MKIASEPFRCKIEIIEKAISKQDSHDDEDDIENNDTIKLLMILIKLLMILIIS